MKREPNCIKKAIAYILLTSIALIAMLGFIKLIKFMWYL